MKKILFGLLLLCFNELAFADNSVTLSVSDGVPGDTVLVQVSISASDRIVAAEFSVPILDGLTYVTESFNAQITGMNFSSTFKGGVLKIYFYNTSLNDSQLANGTLFSFKVRLGQYPGVFRIQPSAILSDADGKPLHVKAIGSDIIIKAPQIVITPEKIDFGHVAIRSSYTKTFRIANTGTTPLNVFSITSSSKEVTISETSFVVQPDETKNLEITYSPTLPGHGDITLTIESDAAENNISILQIVSDAYSINELKVGNIIGESDSVISVDVVLDNMEDIVALQCSFALPEGIRFVDGSLDLSDRLKDMKSFLTENNGVLKLYVYSESEGYISEGSGLVVSFKLQLGSTDGKYDLVPEDVILGNKLLVNVLSGIVVGSIEIKSPIIECNTELDMGATSLTETATGLFLIQNTGKKDLIIDKVTFDNVSYSLNEKCPIIIHPDNKKDIRISYIPEKNGNYSSIMRLYTNDPDNRILDIDITGSIFEPNFISSDVILNTDKKSGVLSISLSNFNSITALQMNIYGLEDMIIDNDSFFMTERCEGLSSVLTINEDGSIKIFVYSLTNKNIFGNNGDLFSFAFSGSRVLDSNLAIKITDIVLSDNQGKNISSIDTMSAKIDEPPSRVGDANDDGKVDVADIIAVVNHIYGQQMDCFNVINADVNGNGIINVSDISEIIAIISDIK